MGRLPEEFRGDCGVSPLQGVEPFPGVVEALGQLDCSLTVLEQSGPESGTTVSPQGLDSNREVTRLLGFEPGIFCDVGTKRQIDLGRVADAEADIEAQLLRLEVDEVAARDAEMEPLDGAGSSLKVDGNARLESVGRRTPDQASQG